MRTTEHTVPKLADLPDRATVMGLGLHGGGLATVRYLAERGVRVTVTDLRDETVLRPSLDAMADLPDVRVVLGRHEEPDFRNADWVVKNPAVPRNNRYLALATRVETDISIFRASFDGRLVAVTGTKGKSGTASAIHFGLRHAGVPAHLGGNITVSPLSFQPQQGHTVVLELSSFQLGDLALTGWFAAGGRLRPDLAVITSFMTDHQDYYGDMDAYARDKAAVGTGAVSNATLVLGAPSAWEAMFRRQWPGKLADGWGSRPDLDSGVTWDSDEGPIRYRNESESGILFPGTPGERGPRGRNRALSAFCLQLLGVEAATAASAAIAYPGIPHRMEFIGTDPESRRFFNDSAATVPEAVIAGVESLARPPVLICGGTDKDLSYARFAEISGKISGLILLEGSATEQIRSAILAGLEQHPGGQAQALPIGGPFRSLEACLNAALEVAGPEIPVLLSPGCASFELFRNEFDRGDQFRALVQRHLARSGGAGVG